MAAKERVLSLGPRWWSSWGWIVWLGLTVAILSASVFGVAKFLWTGDL